jgi:hypothetical protein
MAGNIAQGKVGTNVEMNYFQGKKAPAFFCNVPDGSGQIGQEQDTHRSAGMHCISTRSRY